jgi:hypothetical protein
MSPRKKWRLKLFPSFGYQPEASMKKAYERMLSIGDDYRLGYNNIHQVNIEVDEGDGRGWQLFEICEFPKRSDE